jgi:hypothetical protein
LKYLVAGLALALVCHGASPDVPTYPGAVADKALTASNREHGPQFAELTVYTTSDSFEKVDEYYKKTGAQDVPHSRNFVPSMKYVSLRFPGKQFQVALSWSASDSRHITIIQIFLLKVN